MLPDYIDAGLKWLIEQLKRKEDAASVRSPTSPVQALSADTPAAP